MSEATQRDDAAGALISNLQRRFVTFDRERREDLRQMKHDFIGQFITDHIVVGDKVSYDSMLQGMLTDDEHQLLTTDPQFTRAWRIFVDCVLDEAPHRARRHHRWRDRDTDARDRGLILALPYVAGNKGAQ